MKRTWADICQMVNLLQLTYPLAVIGSLVD